MALDPESMTVIEGDVTAQTGRHEEPRHDARRRRLGLRQGRALLIFLSMDDFGAVNEVYSSGSRAWSPGAGLRRGRAPAEDVLVEIDCLALA